MFFFFLKKKKKKKKTYAFRFVGSCPCGVRHDGTRGALLASKQTTFEIEHELLRLPTYGVFDFVAFGVERGKVTLVGYSDDGG